MRESKVKEFEEARERDPERITYVRIERVQLTKKSADHPLLQLRIRKLRSCIVG